MSNTYTGDHLVEQPAIQLMQHELGWEVVLTGRLRPALRRLNPDLPVEAIERAVDEICRDRTALSLAEESGESVYEAAG